VPYLVCVELKHMNRLLMDLTSADLNCSNFTDANIENSIISDTQFSNLDLSKTKGLDKLKYFGYSTIDLRTLMKSKNLPEQFIKHMHDLLTFFNPYIFSLFHQLFH
jgi:hypothetical protein